VEDISGERWFPWHGPLTQPYRFHYLPQRDYLPIRLRQFFCSPNCSLPEPAADAAALSTLLHCLNGQYQYAGLAGELVQKADRASVALISAAILLRPFIVRNLAAAANHYRPERPADAGVPAQ
jgi:hypothetical protein